VKKLRLKHLQCNVPERFFVREGKYLFNKVTQVRYFRHHRVNLKGIFL
jgi:hypothetical protein